MRSLLLAVLPAAALAACSPYNPDLGANPFLCNMDMSGPMCPSGYACQADTEVPPKMICVETGGHIVDATTNGFQCADDSQLEGSMHNDIPSNAYQTPVATLRTDISFAGLAICPEGDKDDYAINTTTEGQNLEVVVSWDSGMPLSASILGGSGTTLGPATSNGPMSVRAYVANLPMGTYYAQVFAGANVKNNYKLSIKVTGP